MIVSGWVMPGALTLNMDQPYRLNFSYRGLPFNSLDTNLSVVLLQERDGPSHPILRQGR